MSFYQTNPDRDPILKPLKGFGRGRNLIIDDFQRVRRPPVRPSTMA
jgi:hypothetical protein